MRVVAGELGGRRLLSPKGWKVRPTSERVREAIFSALGDVRGMVVADLFCGTGALAIEALSRGAERAVLVDRDTRPALGNIRNLDLTERTELVRADVPEWVAGRAGVAGFDLVFVDPPYRSWRDLDADFLAGLSGLLGPEGVLVTETERGQPPELPALDAARERRYGRTLITFHRPETILDRDGDR